MGIALAFGLIVLAMIYPVGDISGAHLNPAVSLGFFAARRFPLRDVISYILNQCAGAFAASGILRLLFPKDATLGATLPAGSAMQSFVLELILTTILMFVILNVSTGAAEKGITAGIAVGAVIGLQAIFAGPISGASMNPARSLAPAVVSQHPSSLWIYLVAPTAGALLSCPRLSMRAGRRLLLNFISRENVSINKSMKQKVLFICVHNSARSQMAAAWLNDICGDYFEAHSAGLEPGKLNPLAVQVMDEVGIDISNNKTQAVFDVFKSGQFFPYVVTVCDESEAKGCPIFPGVTQRLHWSFPDPAALVGTQQERLQGTRKIRDDIRARIEMWCDEMCVGAGV